MVLFEHALGYALFDVVEFEEIGSMTPQVEAAIKDGSKFRKAVKLNIFRPFKDAAECRENTMAIAEGKYFLHFYYTSGINRGYIAISLYLANDFDDDFDPAMP